MVSSQSQKAVSPTGTPPGLTWEKSVSTENAEQGRDVIGEGELEQANLWGGPTLWRRQHRKREPNAESWEGGGTDLRREWVLKSRKCWFWDTYRTPKCKMIIAAISSVTLCARYHVEPDILCMHHITKVMTTTTLRHRFAITCPPATLQNWIKLRKLWLPAILDSTLTLISLTL